MAARRALLLATLALLLALGVLYVSLLVAPPDLARRIVSDELLVSLRLSGRKLLQHSGARSEIILVGDSRFAQLLPEAWPAQLDQPSNLALSGSTAQWWNDQVQSLPVDAFEGASVIVWVGVNDIVNMKRSATQVMADTLALSARLAQRSKSVIVLDQIPIRLASDVDGAQAREVARVSTALCATRPSSPRIRIVCLHALFEDATGAPARALYAADGIHLSAEGQARVFAHVLQTSP